MAVAILDGRYSWTTEQKQQLKRYFRQGMSYKDIAQKLDKSHHGVAKMLKGMGLRRYSRLPDGDPLEATPADQFYFDEGQEVTIQKNPATEGGYAWKNRPLKFTFLRTINGKSRFHLFQHRSGYKECFTDMQLKEGLK